MKKRIIETVLLWVILLATLYIFEGLGALAIMLITSGLGQWELYKMLEKQGQRPQKELGIFLGSILILGSYFLLTNSGIDSFVFVIIVLFISILKQKDIKNEILPTLFGVVLIPFMLQFYILIAIDYQSLFVPIWLIAVAKSSDTGGLLIGKYFGKHKLAPTISPNKTIEGAAGAILISTFIGILILVLCANITPNNLGLLKATFIAICIGTVAIISDLVESAIKRQSDMDDSGKVFPGIGGVFDLIDSMLLTAPLGYLLIKYIG